jgi:hypothetical protein
MIANDARIRVNPRVEHRSLTGGDAVLLHLDTAAYHGLNPIGELIWGSVGSGTTFGRLVATVRGRLDDAPAALEEDVAAFLSDLVERDLVFIEDEGSAA